MPGMLRHADPSRDAHACAAMGFTPIGGYRNIGWKHGAWRNVGWWQLDPGQPDDGAPHEPRGPQRLGASGPG